METLDRSKYDENRSYKGCKDKYKLNGPNEKNEDVRLETLAKIAMTLDCKLDDLVEYVPDQEEH